MCFRIRRCCWFSNTKDGSFATGVYILILSLLSLTVCAVSIAQFETVTRDVIAEGNRSFLNPSIARINLIISLVLAIVHTFINVILLYGIKNDKRLLLIPWLIWMAIVITFQLVMFALFFIAMFANSIIAIFMGLTGLIAAFHIYCYSCVYSQYMTLSEETHRGTSMPGKV